MTDEQLEERVIVGLGNPGKKYEMTRHNLGFMALQALAKEQGWVFKEEKRFHALVAKGILGKTPVTLLLPQTYMNESGKAVRAFLDFFKLSPHHVLVVSDDIELDYGVMRLRPRGSAGGHNGLKSIEAELRTQHYIRLRLGIGKNAREQHLVDHVLDVFSQDEMSQLPAVVEKAVAAIKLIVTVDIAQAMQSVNTKIKVNPTEGSGEHKHDSKQ